MKIENEVLDIRVSIRGIHYAKWDIRGQNGSLAARFEALTTPNGTFEGENGALAPTRPIKQKRLRKIRSLHESIYYLIMPSSFPTFS